MTPGVLGVAPGSRLVLEGASDPLRHEQVSSANDSSQSLGMGMGTRVGSRWKAGI